MRFIQHKSSSKANLYEVVAGSGRRLLLECGLPWSKLEKALDYDLSNIDGCLITHEHQDHCQAIRVVIARGIDVYASEPTIEAIDEALLLHRRVNCITRTMAFRIGPFNIFPYEIIHDAAGPLGYIIHEGEDWLLFCPDSSFIRQRFNCKFTIIALECNYDRDILNARVDSGKIHEEAAKRIVQSHASKDTTLNYLTEVDPETGEKLCDTSRCREIHLLHCSDVNLDKKATKEDFKENLFIETVIK